MSSRTENLVESQIAHLKDNVHEYIGNIKTESFILMGNWHNKRRFNEFQYVPKSRNVIVLALSTSIFTEIGVGLLSPIIKCL